MKKIAHLKTQLIPEIIPTDQQNNLKGGGWGNGKKSNGNACPPPSLMANKGWGGDNMIS